MGSFGFADDCILLSPSTTICSLYKMLYVCQEFAEEYNVNFDVQKYQLLKTQKMLLHYRPTQDLEQIDGIMFNDIYIPCIKKSIHLGVPLYSTKDNM